MKSKQKRLIHLICSILMAMSLIYGFITACRSESYNVEYTEAKRLGIELDKQEPYTNRELAVIGTTVGITSITSLLGYLATAEEEK